MSGLEGAGRGFLPATVCKATPTALVSFFAPTLSAPTAICRTDGQIAAVCVKIQFTDFPHTTAHRSPSKKIYRSEGVNMAMCGSDDAVRNGGKSGKGTQGTRSAYTGIRANGRCRTTQWSNRLSLKFACGLRVSRPALALSRRQLGASEVVGRLPEWS